MPRNPVEEGTLPLSLFVLTVTTGLIDGVSVLGLGRVFTANMTGNIVFLGFALAAVPGFSPSRSLLALGAFLVGAVVGGRLAVRFAGSRRRWFFVAGLTEAVLLFAAGLIAVGFDPRALKLGPRVNLLIALTAVAMGVRNATVRRLAVSDLTTTVLTLTLTGLGADSSLAGGSNPRWARRLASVCAMLGGAVIGGLLVRSGATAEALGLAGLLALAATLLYVLRPEKPTPA